MSGIVWLNGALLDTESARISPADRGFLLGDGVFETIRSYNSRLFALDRHLERLHEGADTLAIDLPPLETLAEAAEAVNSASGLADGRVRVTVTGGCGSPGLAREDGRPTMLVSAAPAPSWPAKATAVVAPWRVDEQSPLAGVKTTSRADSVLAARHAASLGADEALLLNHRGELSEATAANVFVVSNGRVETPPLSSGCLAGITREHVLRLCDELDIESREVAVTPASLADADELFLTSCTRQVQPLVRFEGLTIADGEVGPVTARLAEAFREVVERETGPRQESRESR
jgi:branched-chain amino acid aminotransferase